MKRTKEVPKERRNNVVAVQKGAATNRGGAGAKVRLAPPRGGR